jgi:hypothetical protein
LTYVLIVKVWGPNYMKNREPLNIRKFLIGYNFFQVVLSTYIFVQVSSQVSFSNVVHSSLVLRPENASSNAMFGNQLS